MSSYGHVGRAFASVARDKEYLLYGRDFGVNTKEGVVGDRQLDRRASPRSRARGGNEVPPKLRAIQSFQHDMVDLHVASWPPKGSSTKPSRP